MGWVAIPATVRWSPESCAKCGKYYRREGDVLCPACAHLQQEESEAFRRGDPESIPKVKGEW